MNHKFTEEEVTILADKLLIGISKEEAKDIVEELTFVADSMNVISEIKEIENLEPLTHPFDLYETSLREDDSFEEGHDIEDLLSNADFTQGREIEVPKVVG